MAGKRKDDAEERAQFRSERLVKETDGWYFFTREDDCKGLFSSDIEAENQLQTYIKVMESGLVTVDTGLSME